MEGVSRLKYCRVCGKEIPEHVKYKLYCSKQCQREGEKAACREYYHRHVKHMRPRYGTVKGKHEDGYISLATEIICTAIDDIRACSLREIERYEDPAYMAKGAATAKCMRYLSAKSFLLSQRFTMFCKWSGKDIYNYLIEEKKQKEAEPND